MAPGTVLAFGLGICRASWSPLSSQEVSVPAGVGARPPGLPAPVVSQFHFLGFNTETVPSPTGFTGKPCLQPKAAPTPLGNLEGVPPPHSMCKGKQARQLSSIWCQLSQPQDWSLGLRAKLSLK